MGWCSLTGTGASLHLKVPRVNELPNVDFLLGHDRSDVIHCLVSQRKLLPSDIDQFGNPWLLVFASRGAIESATILLESGFDPTMSNMCGESAFDQMLLRLMRQKKGLGDYIPQSWASAVQRVMEDHEPGYTLLHKSLIGLAPISLERAIREEPHAIDTPDFISGSSPLFLATEIEDADAVRILINYGCNVDLPNQRQDLTPLMNACIRDNEDNIEKLISNGANIHAVNSSNWTALHLAASSSNYESSLQLLLGSGANPNARTDDQRTPLHLVANNRSNSVKSTRALLQANADLNAIDEWGNTPLMVAIQLDNVDVAGALASFGANFDGVDIDGRGTLHHLMTSRASRCIRALAASHWDGIDPDLGDEDGYSPLDLLKFECEYDYQGSPFVPPVIQGIIGAAELIVEIRERNFEGQLFLDTRDRFTADGSHRKLKLWIRDFQGWLQAKRCMPHWIWDPKRMPWYTQRMVRECDPEDVDIETWSVRKAWWEDQSDYFDSDEGDDTSSEGDEVSEGDSVEDGNESGADDGSRQDGVFAGEDSDSEEIFFDAEEG